VVVEASVVTIVGDAVVDVAATCWRSAVTSLRSASSLPPPPHPARRVAAATLATRIVFKLPSVLLRRRPAQVPPARSCARIGQLAQFLYLGGSPRVEHDLFGIQRAEHGADMAGRTERHPEQRFAVRAQTHRAAPQAGVMLVGTRPVLPSASVRSCCPPRRRRASAKRSAQGCGTRARHRSTCWSPARPRLLCSLRSYESLSARLVRAATRGRGPTAGSW
jgi:hypothetical protein